MTDNVINLRQARKRLKKAEKEKTARENRQRFGRSKSQKQAENKERESSVSRLDGHQRDRDDGAS